MHPFSFSLLSVRRLIFGPQKLSQLDAVLADFGNHVLLVTGSRSLQQSTVYGRLLESCRSAGKKLFTAQVIGEPSPEQIDSLVAEQSGNDIDLVIGVGGGAVLDSAKALAAMLVEGGEVCRFLEGVGTDTPSGSRLPLIAIPTTSGTGSETTANGVLSRVSSDGDTVQGFKKSLRHPNYLPDIAIVDPELTLSCSAELTFACGMDAFSQLVEGYLSTKASPLTDSLALDGIRAINRSLQPAIKDGTNLAARCDLAYGATLSGIVLTNAGLGAVHAMAGPIGGFSRVPHGLACAALMAPTNRATLNKLRQEQPDSPALLKYAELGRIVSAAETQNRKYSDQWYQDAFIARLETLSTLTALPPLGQFGLTETACHAISSSCGNKNNPVPLNDDELAEILLSRL